MALNNTDDYTIDKSLVNMTSFKPEEPKEARRLKPKGCESTDAPTALKQTSDCSHILIIPWW